MRSAETAAAVNRAVAEGRCRFIRANFAGGDMVGHTGNLEATVIALEAIDLAIGRILGAVAAAKGCLVVTADHGNAETWWSGTKPARRSTRTASPSSAPPTPSIRYRS